MFGPTGIGILYGREALLEAMPPYQGGGDMIETVSYDGTTFNTLPYKFEAGTPHIAGAVGLAEAVAFLDDIDIDLAAAYEHELLTYATERMRDVPACVSSVRLQRRLVSSRSSSAMPIRTTSARCSTSRVSP